MALMDRLSCCTFPLQTMPIDEALAAIAAAGFHKADVLGRAPHLVTSLADAARENGLERKDVLGRAPHLVRADAARVQAAADACRVQLANLGTYVGEDFASADASVQEQAFAELCGTLDVAKAMGARSIRVKAGDDTERCIDRIVPWFQRGAAHAEKTGVYMGFENHGGEISGNPNTCKTLCERVGSTMFGVLFDPCNLMQAGTDYRDAFSVFGPHITHVHFKDGRPSANGTWERCGLGDGVIDFSWLISQLEALGYVGDYAVEFELNGGHGNVEMARLALEPTAGLKKWHQAFRQMVARL